MKKLNLLVAGIALTAALASCGGKSIDTTKISNGMTKDEVEAAVGKSDGHMFIMGTGSMNYGSTIINFENDTVVSVETN